MTDSPFALPRKGIAWPMFGACLLAAVVGLLLSRGSVAPFRLVAPFWAPTVIGAGGALLAILVGFAAFPLRRRLSSEE